jgi:amidase
MVDELARTDAVGQAELVRSGQLSPRELVDAAIARIEQLDPELNAVIHPTFDKAQAAADSPDLPDGPFRGVPMLIKDLWPATAGDPHHLGVKALKAANHIGEVDANIVTSYRRAGFVIVGRTNTPELGLMATTEPQSHGPTRNPWNTDHGAGGSSGGASAAVASGMIPAANASDGGGSIRIPAAMCGLVGLKPSRGRVSMGPAQDEWSQSVQHVVSHTMRDTAAILDVSCGRFPGDGVVAPGPDRPYIDEVGAEVGKLRIGFMVDSGRAEVHPEVAEGVRAAAALLESLGHSVEEAHPPVIDRLGEVTASFSAVWAAGAVRQLERLGEMLGREVGPDDVEPGTWMMAQRGRDVSGADVVKAQEAQHVFRRDMASWWAEGWDLLLTPTTAEPPPVIGDVSSRPDEPYRGMQRSVPFAVYTSMFNTTGQPAISLPLGRTSAGLPIGTQLVADYGREDLLIRIGAQLEAEVRWADTRAPLHL